MLNDVSAAFNGWLEPIDIIRKEQGDYVDGNWVDAQETIVSIRAVVQNANADDLILLPEGTRSTETVKIHTTSLVKTVSEVTETEADQFEYNGSKYKIHDVYDRKIGNYYKALAIRVKS